MKLHTVQLVMDYLASSKMKYKQRTHSEHTSEHFLPTVIACVVKPSTLNQHKHSARSYKRSEWPFFLPYLGVPLLVWELCMAKGECRESSGNRANRRVLV